MSRQHVIDSGGRNPASVLGTYSVQNKHFISLFSHSDSLDPQEFEVVRYRLISMINKQPTMSSGA